MSLNRRVEKLENQTLTTDQDVPSNLQDLYKWENSPEGQKAIDLLYSETENYTPE